MDGTTEATPQSGSLAEATQRIAGLLSVKPDTEKPADTQPEPTPREAAAESKLAPAAPDTGSEQAEPASDEADTESAQPPKTWKVRVAEEDVEVTEDELVKGYSRHGDYTRKMQALADERRKWEDSEVAAARAVRDQQQKGLEEIKQALTKLQPKEPNWEELRKTATPDEFADALLGWKQHVDAVAQIEGEQQRLREAETADLHKRLGTVRQDEVKKLLVELPELADPKTGAPTALYESVCDHARSLGFTNEDLNATVDHRLFVMLHDAYQYRAGKAKAPAEKAKIENKIKDALVEAKPGARTDASSSKARALAADQKRLRESGRIEDATSVFKRLLT